VEVFRVKGLGRQGEFPYKTRIYRIAKVGGLLIAIDDQRLAFVPQMARLKFMIMLCCVKPCNKHLWQLKNQKIVAFYIISQFEEKQSVTMRI